MKPLQDAANPPFRDRAETGIEQDALLRNERRFRCCIHSLALQQIGPSPTNSVLASAPYRGGRRSRLVQSPSRSWGQCIGRWPERVRVLSLQSVRGSSNGPLPEGTVRRRIATHLPPHCGVGRFLQVPLKPQTVEPGRVAMKRCQAAMPVTIAARP